MRTADVRLRPRDSGDHSECISTGCSPTLCSVPHPSSVFTAIAPLRPLPSFLSLSRPFIIYFINSSLLKPSHSLFQAPPSAWLHPLLCPLRPLSPAEKWRCPSGGWNYSLVPWLCLSGHCLLHYPLTCSSPGMKSCPDTGLTFTATHMLTSYVFGPSACSQPATLIIALPWLWAGPCSQAHAEDLPITIWPFPPCLLWCSVLTVTPEALVASCLLVTIASYSICSLGH